MMGLTKRQADLLAFLKSFAKANGGMAPTFDEMAFGIGLKSKSGIFRIISALEDRGLVRRIHGRQRAIELIEATSNPALAFLSTLDSRTALAISSEALRSGFTPQAVMVGWLTEKASSQRGAGA